MFEKQKLIKAKEKAERLKRFLLFIHSKNDKLLKAINAFLKCNLSDKSIYSKYELMKTLSELKGGFDE